MTFSSPPTQLHVSTEPQHSKNKHQKRKMFHSKPKSHSVLTKKPSPNIGMRSGCSFKKNQQSPIADANGMVFNSYLKKNYDRNCQSSPKCLKPHDLPQLWQIAWVYHPSSTHFSCTPMHYSPHCAPKPLCHCSSHASMWRIHDTPQ